MALSSNALGALIKANIDALSPTDKQVDLKVWTAVAEAIVTHITTSAQVNAGIAVTTTGVGNLSAPVASTGATISPGTIS